MDEQPKSVLIRDPSQLPSVLGHIVIAWNRCEGAIRELPHTLASLGNVELRTVSDILISELGTVGLAQALKCFADEFPLDHQRLSEEVDHVAAVYGALRPHRNYNVHGITAFTPFGMVLNEDTLKDEKDLHERIEPGPFANIQQRTAKGKLTFAIASVRYTEHDKLLAQLEKFEPYIKALNSALNDYFHGREYEAKLLARPNRPDALVKQAVRTKSLLERPFLAPRKQGPQPSETEG